MATPDQWAYQEHWAVEDSNAACLLELRARVEALEAAEQASAPASAEARPAPASSLVERVASAIDNAPYDEDLHQWDEARAAIREIAAALLQAEHRSASNWLLKEAAKQ